MNRNKESVVALFLAGKAPKDILRELAHLGVNRKFVYRTIKRFKETGSTARKPGSGRKKTATSAQQVKKVKERLRRNPRRSARKLSRELGISDRSVRRILREHLQVKPFKVQKVHALSEKQKQVRLERCKLLRERHARSELSNIVFSDEKIFTVEQIINKQNDRLWLPDRQGDNAELLQVGRTQAPASVMVWAGVTADGRTPLVFIPQGVKVNSEIYREQVLQEAFLPWVKNHFKNRPYTFQQDSAPSHTARATKDWFRANGIRFITPEEWPPYSPDLNPMDFAMWSILEAKVSAKKYTTIEGLKASLQREWKNIPQEIVRASCEAFITRLDRAIRAKGGHFET